MKLSFPKPIKKSFSLLNSIFSFTMLAVLSGELSSTIKILKLSLSKNISSIISETFSDSLNVGIITRDLLSNTK